MITISQIVEELIQKTPFIEEGINNGIINLSSLARQFRPQVEEKLMKRVETAAILMALRRMKKNERAISAINTIFRKQPEIIIRSNLVDFTVENSASLAQNHEKLLSLIRRNNRYFFTITQGVFETAIVISSELETEAKKILGREKINAQITGLSAITIRMSEDNAVTPGVYYHILKSLAWENINIVEVVSTQLEFTLIMEDKNIDRAFSILKKCIS